MNTDKKHIFFFVAVGVLILSVVYRLMNPYVQPRVTRLTYTGKVHTAENRGRAKGGNDPVEKRTQPGDDPNGSSEFIKKTKISGRVHQDLFSLYKPPPKINPQKESRPGEKEDPVKNIESVEKIDQDPLGEIKEYLTSYKIYGQYESSGQKAVFLAKNKLVLVARTGDRIDGKYEIEDIQEDFIRIKAVDLNETMDISIGEFNDE